MRYRPFLLLGLWLVLGTSLEASSTLIFPRLSFAPQDLTGIAIVNPGEETASVTFTAYGVDGQVLAGEGSSSTSDSETGPQPQGAFTNPVTVDIPAGQQFAEVTIGIFGSGVDPDAIGWVEATSEADDLTGFFQVLDFDISFLDGADLPVPDSRLIFQDVRVDQGFSTTAYLVNPNGPGTASVELSLVTSESIKTKSLEIAAKGIVELNVEEFFEGMESAGEVAGGAYLIADSNVEIAGFELVGKEGEDLLGLNARPASELLTTLFFPQLAVLDIFTTEAVAGNFGEEAAIITMTVYQESGEIYTDEVQTNPVVVALDPGEILRTDLEETFGFAGKATLQGWLKVESTSQSINGSISYSIPSLGTIASVSSVREGSRRALISHLGTAAPFFTGLAILNAGALAANVRVVALTKEGEVLGTFTTTLQPGERISKPVTDLIPGAVGQNGGMLWIESDVPVYLTAIFGSATVFANVPPQPVPESFQPDMGIDQIEVKPPLAVLLPAQVQQFELEGSMTVPVWGVNRITGGNAQTGTISGTGLYTAPAVIPLALPVTIVATADNQTAGASVDVQTKTVLVGGLGIIQSVAYLAGLERLYTSELSFGASPARTKSPHGSEQSTIFDVTTGVQQSVAVFGDDIPKMVPYLAADGKEYLLLAGKASGSIVRLDPQSQTSMEVASGLNAPNSLVIDPVAGDLLVAEADQVSTIPASQLNQGLTGAGLAELEIPSGARLLAAGLEPTGIAVDRCTANVYVSQASTGEVLKIDRLTGEVRTIAEGLSEPGQLLGFYRSGISCPDAFHLLVIETFFFPEEEREASQITLLVPSTGLMTLWLAESSVVIPDITLLPPGSPLGNEAVLIAENFGDGQISQVEIVDRYEPHTINPPQIENCLGTVTIADPNLDSAIRGSLGIGLEDPITCQMAQSVTSLIAASLGITSLAGLEEFANLEGLNLNLNQISDISPLVGLTQLVSLFLHGSQISDISPLAGLTRLELLGLQENQISDISPLAGLTRLEFLGLGDNQISDISPLAGLTRLDDLRLNDNQIGDISPLASLEFPRFRGHLILWENGGHDAKNKTSLSTRVSPADSRASSSRAQPR